MRKLILSLLLMGSAACLLAQGQGTIVYNNRVPGQVDAPVYGPELIDPLDARQGNTASGIPPGIQVYSGVLLTGSGFTAELWGALGPNQLESALIPVVGSLVEFRSDAPGYIVAPSSELVIPFVLEGGIASLQLRAWNNQAGAITSFAQAMASGVAWGVSPVFNSLPLGGTLPGPNMVGLVSFNIHVPEPSALVLVGVGLSALLMFRRRKS